jgi:thiopeptide-type bacteriocin biosynthesis protein
VRLRLHQGTHERSMRQLFERLLPAVPRGGFFFARKAPGLRLRFAVDAQGWNAVAACLDGARAVSRWNACAYEPEVFKLGGPAALPAVHRWFADDTRAWWAWESRQAPFSRAVLSLAVLNDLFARFSEGPEETWDLWCRVGALHGQAPEGRSGVPAIRPADLAPRLAVAQRRILAGQVAANQRLARAFERLHRAGRLLFGRRLVLPHLALAHFNRHGFALADRLPIVSAMTGAFSRSVHPDHPTTKE